MLLQVVKQITYEGCLPVCLLNLADIKVTREKELNLLFNAISKDRDAYYVYNNLLAFVQEYGRSVNLYIDDRYYVDYLNKINKDKRIIIKYKLVKDFFSLKENFPFILYVDIHNFGEYVHAPHLIIVEREYNDIATIVDHWVGKRTRIKKQLLFDAIFSLRDRLRYAPLAITLQDLISHE